MTPRKLKKSPRQDISRARNKYIHFSTEAILNQPITTKNYWEGNYLHLKNSIQYSQYVWFQMFQFSILDNHSRPPDTKQVTKCTV